MEIRKGIAVSPGIVMAEALVLDAEDYRIPTRYVEKEQIDHEKEILGRAIQSSIKELKIQREGLDSRYGEDTAAIFDFHIGVLNDSKIRTELDNLITKQSSSAAYAVSRTYLTLQRRFDKLKDPVFAQRMKDVQDIEKRLLRHLLGEEREDLEHLTKDVILVAHDLPPSLCAGLDKTRVVGVATDVGGLTSHTAIILRSMDMPSVIGLSDFTKSEVSGGELVIVDGRRSLAINNPDLDTIRRYESEINRRHELADDSAELRNLPATTIDGEEIQLLANIEFCEEVESCNERGAAGIGLYRTEYLFIRSETDPEEEEQYLAYSKSSKVHEGQACYNSHNGPWR